MKKMMIIGVVAALIISACGVQKDVPAVKNEIQNMISQSQESFVSIDESVLNEKVDETVEETEVMGLRATVNAPLIDEFSVTVDSETMFNVYADVVIPDVDRMAVVKGQWKTYTEEDIAKVWNFCKTDTAVLNDPTLVNTMVSRTYSDIELYKGYEQNQITEDTLQLFNLFLDYQKTEMAVGNDFRFTELTMPDGKKQNAFLAAIKDGLHEGHMRMSDKDIYFGWDADNWLASVDTYLNWRTAAIPNDGTFMICDKTQEVETLGFEKHIQAAEQFMDLMSLEGYLLCNASVSEAPYKADAGKMAYSLSFEKRYNGINISTYGIVGPYYNKVMFYFVEDYLERVTVGYDFECVEEEAAQLLSYDEIRNVIIAGDYWNKEYLPKLKDGKFWPMEINKIVLEYSLLEDETGQVSLVPCWNLYRGYRPGDFDLQLSINAVDGTVINCFTYDLEVIRSVYE